MTPYLIRHLFASFQIAFKYCSQLMLAVSLGDPLPETPSRPDSTCLKAVSKPQQYIEAVGLPKQSLFKALSWSYAG